MVKYALDSGLGGIRFRQLFLCCEIFNVSKMLDVKLLSESKFFFPTQISIRKLGHVYLPFSYTSTLDGNQVNRDFPENSSNLSNIKPK